MTKQGIQSLLDTIDFDGRFDRVTKLFGEMIAEMPDDLIREVAIQLAQDASRGEFKGKNLINALAFVGLRAILREMD